MFLSKWPYDQKMSIWYDYSFQVSIERQVLLLKGKKSLARDLRAESFQTCFLNHLVSNQIRVVVIWLMYHSWQNGTLKIWFLQVTEALCHLSVTDIKKKKTFCNVWFVCKNEACVNCDTLNAKTAIWLLRVVRVHTYRNHS